MKKTRHEGDQERNSLEEMPWLDLRLTEKTMNHLWDNINPAQSTSEPDDIAIGTLAGNISKSKYIQDKDNWFYENILKDSISILFYREWNNYYDYVLKKTKPSPVFALDGLWVNYQKQNEFNPPHMHTGHYSFVVFMKIPTHWKEQHALSICANSNTPAASDFQFFFGFEGGQVAAIQIPLCPEDEGRMLFFPAWLKHQVFPFYECEEERITISGNIRLYDPNKSE